MRIVGALWDFWMDRGYAREGQFQAQRFLARPEAAVDTFAQARGLFTAGTLAFYGGRFAAAPPFLLECIALSRRLGMGGKRVLALALVSQGHMLLSLEELDATEAAAIECLRLGHELQEAFIQGHALLLLAGIARLRGETNGARQYFLDCIKCVKSYGATGMHGTALFNYGRLLYEQGDYVAAHAYLTRSLTIYEEVDDSVRRSIALRQLGVMAMAQDKNVEAQALLNKALKLIRQVGQLRQLNDVLDVMGRLALQQRDYARASALLEESFGLAVEVNHSPWIARALEALACLAAAQGNIEQAAQLFGAAETHELALETRLDPMWHASHEHWIAAVRTQLGEPAFSTLWELGAVMDLDLALDYAVGNEETH
jgi:tetratricopeptide (TPR) repeat protein